MSYEYGAYDDDAGFDTFQTFDEAIRGANESIDGWRDLAMDGWPDEVDNTCVVLLTHETVMVNERPNTDGFGDCDTLCDYKLQPTAEWSRISQKLEEYDDLVEELNHSKEIRNQLAENCNNWRGRSHNKAVELKHSLKELERVSDQLSDVWLYLDMWARSESVTIEDVKALCATLLRKQQAPGWKPVVKESFTTPKEGE